MSNNELFNSLKQFDTPTICNAIELFGIRPKTCGFGRPGMVQRSGDFHTPMVGYAVTAKIGAMFPETPEQKELKFQLYESARNVDGPSIICIQDIDPQPLGSFWGEVQASIFKSLGAVGTLTAGGVRDIPAGDTVGFNFMSTHVLVSHAYIHVEAIDCPVILCGLEIRPGDLIHADIHGFTVIPREIAPQLAAACEGLAANEGHVINPCREAIKNGIRPSMEEIRAWNQAMANANRDLAETLA